MVALNVIGETTLAHRRDTLTYKYLLKSASLINNPVISSIKQLSKSVHNNKKSKSKWIMKNTLHIYNKIKEKIQDIFQTELAISYEFPLESHDPEIHLEVVTVNPLSTEESNLDQIVLTKFSEYDRIFVDAAKPLRGESQGIAIFHENSNFISQRNIKNAQSSTDAELCAILMGLRFVKSNNFKRVILFSDSMEALKTIANKKIDAKTSATTLDCRLNIRFIIRQNKQIYLAWIPGHKGSTGMQITDRAAKEAIISPISFYFKPNWFQLYKSISLKLSEDWHDFHSSSLYEKDRNYLNKLAFVNPYFMKKLFNQFKKEYTSMYLRILTNSQCTPEKLFKFNLIESVNCICGHDFCDLHHIAWECNQNIVLREEMKESLQNKFNINVTNTPSVLATMNVEVIKIFCEFLTKAGVRI